jgi:hypothetical protein
LSKSKNGDEKLAWDGKENEDDIFFTPFQSLLKEDVNYEVVSKNSQCHLEVNGTIHFVIVEQLTNHMFLHFLGFCTLEHPRKSKQKGIFKSVIKLGTRQLDPLPCGFDYNQRSISQIVSSGPKTTTFELAIKSTSRNHYF